MMFEDDFGPIFCLIYLYKLCQLGFSGQLNLGLLFLESDVARYLLYLTLSGLGLAYAQLYHDLC